MHAAVFSRGEGRAMGSVLEEPMLNETATIDSAQTIFTTRWRRQTMTIPRSG